MNNEVQMAEAPAADAGQGLISRSELDNQINDTVGLALTLTRENFEKKLEERFSKVEKLLEDSRRANSTATPSASEPSFSLRHPSEPHADNLSPASPAPDITRPLKVS